MNNLKMKKRKRIDIISKNVTRIAPNVMQSKKVIAKNQKHLIFYIMIIPVINLYFTKKISPEHDFFKQ